MKIIHRHMIKFYTKCSCYSICIDFFTICIILKKAVLNIHKHMNLVEEGNFVSDSKAEVLIIIKISLIRPLCQTIAFAFGNLNDFCRECALSSSVSWRSE